MNIPPFGIILFTLFQENITANSNKSGIFVPKLKHESQVASPFQQE